MNVLFITHAINGFLMIAMPIGLTIYLTHTFNQGWRLFWIGATTFLISQVLHIPFNALVSPIFNQFSFLSLPVTMQNVILSIFAGLSAGIFEEISRYGMYQWWAKDARTWSKGMIVGAGHGGIEAIILGLIVIYAYIQMLLVRGIDISTLVKPDQVALAKAQIAAYWSLPWYMTMLGALERIFAIITQLGCSVLVLQAFTRKKFWWIVLAIFYHALVDAVSVFVVKIGFSALEIEGIIGIFAILSVIIILTLRQPEIINNTIPVQYSTPEFKPEPVDESKEKLHETRYQ